MSTSLTCLSLLVRLNNAGRHVQEFAMKTNLHFLYKTELKLYTTISGFARVVNYSH